MMLEQIGKQAKQAARVLAGADTETKNRALLAMADAIEQGAEQLLAANGEDMAAARAAGMNDTMLDRLQLTAERILVQPTDIRRHQLRALLSQQE